MTKSQIEDIEVGLLMEAVFQRYGYDFRSYAAASLKRRVNNLLAKMNYRSISDLIPAVLRDKSVFEALAYNLSITVTEMFRDPFVYKAIREKVVPYLKTYPFIKIWHAGCATGEEVYSFAILLKEEGLYDRAQIYATDFNDVALAKAKEGIYATNLIRNYTQNYQQAGGKASFSDYYHSRYDSAILSKDLKKNITFANHNLATDSIFGEMHLIICRNVLIYFDRKLQNRVFELFQESLIHGGYMCLGTKETIQFSGIERGFDVIAKKEKIYQKKK